MVALILAIVSIVLKYIAIGKEFWTGKNIAKKILLAIGITIGMVAFFVTVSKNYEVVNQERGSVCVTANGFMYLAENFYRSSMHYFETKSYFIPATYFLSYLSGLLTIIALLLTIYYLMSALFNETSIAGTVICSSVFSVISLVWLVLSILAKDDFISLQLQMGGISSMVNIYVTGAIIGFIFSLILLAISIVCKSLSKSKEIPQIN